MAFPAACAVAGTTGAAWALAHAGADRIVLPPGEEQAALADLPITSLRLDAGTVTGLRRLGLRTVQELLRIPRAQITARFGAMPVLRLDQALGAIEEAIDWPRPPIEWHERLAFAEPIGTPEDLARALAQLAEAAVPCVWRSRTKAASASSRGSSASMTSCRRSR